VARPLPAMHKRIAEHVENRIRVFVRMKASSLRRAEWKHRACPSPHELPRARRKKD
jgi:hypothetical protein